MLRTVRVRDHERGLLFQHKALRRVLPPGNHTLFGGGYEVQVVSTLAPWLEQPELPALLKSGKLGTDVEVIDLKDGERALVWVDGRFARVLGPGVYAAWNTQAQVRVERLASSDVRFEHAQLAVILASPGATEWLQPVTVPPAHAALVFLDGKHHASLPPGSYAFWRQVGELSVQVVDQRETNVDIAGQDIMTADKVTLRINAVVTFKVEDPLRAVTEVDDYRQALYREAQLALRAVVGGRELDPLLSDKEAVAADLQRDVAQRASVLGLRIRSVGIRDVILPGEMRELLNKVTEAKKAAEASLITRREETAAMRSQANTAKVLENNPTLMRMRELEVLQQVAAKSSFTVVLGPEGLSQQLVKML